MFSKALMTRTCGRYSSIFFVSFLVLCELLKTDKSLFLSFSPSMSSPLLACCCRLVVARIFLLLLRVASSFQRECGVQPNKEQNYPLFPRLKCGVRPIINAKVTGDGDVSRKTSFPSQPSPHDQEITDKKEA